MNRPVTYAPRAHASRAMRYSLTKARDAAADAACRANVLTDLRLGLLVFAGAFVFLLALGVM